jgi:hypothetical protein
MLSKIGEILSALVLDKVFERGGNRSVPPLFRRAIGSILLNE